MTKRLRLTQGELKTARDEAVQTRTDSEQKIADLNTNVTTQLATKASTDDLSATNSSVTVVKTDLEGTKNDLQMARSELGTLIARNHEDIDTLRRMGERDYVEFTVTGKGKAAKGGKHHCRAPLGTDPKKNQFTCRRAARRRRPLTEEKSRRW